MDYMDLTDEEILNAIKAARVVATEKNEDFFDTLRNTMKFMLIAKKVEGNSSDVELKATTEVEQENTITSHDVKAMLEEGEEKVKELSKTLDKLLEKYEKIVAGYTTHGWKASDLPYRGEEFKVFFETVKCGSYTPEELKKAIKDINIVYNSEMSRALSESNIGDSEFINMLNDINSTLRGNYYIACKFIDDDTMEDKRKYILQAYTSLQNELRKDLLHALSMKKSYESHSSPEGSYAFLPEPWLVDFINFMKEIRSKKVIGYTNDPFGMYPNAYETNLRCLQEYVQNLSIKIIMNKKSIPNITGLNELIDFTRDKIRQYQYMNVDEFREHSIDKMQLSFGEKESYDSRIEMMLSEKTRKHGI